MRFGICAPFQQIALLQHISFDYLEESVQRFLVPEQPAEDFAALLKAARALPVKIEAANSFIPPDLPLIATPGRPVETARLERYVRTALQRAEQAGIGLIVFGSGDARACPPGYDHHAALQQIGAHLVTWCEWAAQHGVEIVLEPLRYEETNTLNTVAESGAFVAQLGNTGLRLLADVYHMLCNGEDPSTISLHASLLSHVHVAEQESRSAPGRHGEDFRAFFSELRRNGYARRISLECQWDDLPEEVEMALMILRAQWATC